MKVVDNSFVRFKKGSMNYYSTLRKVLSITKPGESASSCLEGLPGLSMALLISLHSFVGLTGKDRFH